MLYQVSAKDNMEMMEKIYHNERLLAFIVRRDYVPQNGTEFLTDNSAVQQAGAMKHPVGHIIKNHIHKPIERTVYGTPEAVFVRSGRVGVNLFDENKELAATKILEAGDIIFLVSGGHGFKMLEESVLLEIKQGPYFDQSKDKDFF